MSSKLYVGNLPFEATESEVRSLFEQAGTIESIRIVTDRYSGRPRGFAFVEMVTEAEAAKAIQLLNGHPMRGRDLVVSQARGSSGEAEGAGGKSPKPYLPQGPSPSSADAQHRLLVLHGGWNPRKWGAVLA